MTKKDYELFANEIFSLKGKNATPPEMFNSWVDLTAQVFAKDSESFQERKYRTACYEGKHIRKSIKEGV